MGIPSFVVNVRREAHPGDFPDSALREPSFSQELVFRGGQLEFLVAIFITTENAQREKKGPMTLVELQNLTSLEAPLGFF